MGSNDVGALLFVQTDVDDVNIGEIIVKEANRKWDEIGKNSKKHFIGIGDDLSPTHGTDDRAVAVITIKFRESAGYDIGL
jgi:hypothetical protein